VASVIDRLCALLHVQPDGTFFKAILNLHMEDFEEAHKYIDRTRELLDTELRALVPSSSPLSA
jgi:FKBP12-rapamycin complex-associated protein